MIHIVSGWSNPGGSTQSWISLTNELNRIGEETVFYGPHEYHTKKCNGKHISRFCFSVTDSVIIHFLKIPYKLECKKMVFSSHEQNIFPISNINYKIFDCIHFVSEHQKKYHNIDFSSIIIPNIVDDLKHSKKPSNIAGIIGSIDQNKQTHISIERALSDNMKKVLLYGNITDLKYYKNFVEPLIDNNKVVFVGYEDNKQKIYDSISVVYQDSLLESWGYIFAECKKTGVEYKGPVKNIEIWDNEKIIEEWLKILK